jgi:hypothetical protein
MTATDTAARKPGRVPLASFGAALATLAIAPSVEASIISLNINPKTATFGGNYGGAAVHLKAGVYSFTFTQTNGTLFGKDIYNSPNLAFRKASLSSTITTGQNFTGFIPISAAADGTHYYGFLTTAGQVGWISMNLGGTGGDIHYLAAALETEGSSIHVGTTGVPEPSTASLLGFGVLALGAAGVLAERRRRKQLSAPADA